MTWKEKVDKKAEGKMSKWMRVKKDTVERQQIIKREIRRERRLFTSISPAYQSTKLQ